jgi:VanZ family protein
MLFRAAAFGWAILILVLSLMPSSGIPLLPVPHFDKLAHLGMYSILALLSARAFHVSFSFSMLLFLLVTLYGFGIELLQHFIPTGRMFDVWDVVANGLGAAVGISVFVLFGSNKKARTD